MIAEFLIGSPRKKGNTIRMATLMADKLPAESFTTHFTCLYDYRIDPCKDCRGCKKGNHVCVIRDDMTDICLRLEFADILIFGTPIYWFGPTAKTKLMLDRLRPYYENRLLEGKSAALIMPAADGEGDCDLSIMMFQRIFKALGIEYLGVVTAKAYDEGDVSGDVKVENDVAILGTRISALTNC